MIDLLENVGDRIVGVIMATLAMVNGLLAAAPETIIPPRQETAIVRDAVVSPTQGSVITPGLLPIVTLLPPRKATSTKAAMAAKARIPATTSPVVVASSTTVAVPPMPTAPTITAQWLSENTKLSFKHKRDGTYDGVFTASTSGRDLTWSAGDAFIGGSAPIPKFAFSISCSPPLEVPPPDLPNPIPFFKVRTPYDCTIGFAATSGSDQKTRSKDLHFETSPGQLVVTPPSAMSTLLEDNVNNGGFVFDNQDLKPVTVTKLVLDLSYTALSTLNGPLVLRILNPLSGASLFDYHMENLSADPTIPYTYAATGVEAPIHFTLAPANRKLLPIQLLGVHRLSMPGVDPKVTITLRALTIDQNDVPLVLNASQIHWRCVVALGAYNPNATSGPFATGEACR